LSIVIDNVLRGCERSYCEAVAPGSRVTIRDVAARAGVSVATISKVINQRYGVAADTSARVQAVMEEMGYEASLVARSLRNHITNVIGVLVSDFNPFSTELLKGVADAISGTGYDLVVYCASGRSGDYVGWERRYLSRLSGTLLDGAVLVTPTILDVPRGSPVVAVDPHTGPSDLPTIDSDNLLGARRATEHLVQLGHRRIAMLLGRPDLRSAQLREQGYRQALRAAGLPVDERLIKTGPYSPAISRDPVRRLLSGAKPPTAVFASSDVAAMATMEIADELGLRVPRDLSVVGFDNIPESALCSPPLTTISQPIRQMGQCSIELLIQLIRGEPTEATHVTLATTLVERQSTSAPGRARR
jgi:LacI family transcriptional regulator